MIDNLNVLKMRRLVYLCLTLAVLLCSCEKFVNMQQDITADGLSLSHNNIDMYPGGGSMQILLTTGQSWTVSFSDNSWLSVLDEYGTSVNAGKSGTFVLNLSADVNKTDRRRTSTLTFRSGGLTETVTVTQEVPYLRVNHAGNWLETEFDKAYFWYISENKPDAEHVFRIESNTWWKVTGAEDDFVLNQSEGEGDFNLLVLPRDINVSSEDRTMHLILEGPDTRHKFELKFVQEYLVFILHNNIITSCNEFGTEVSGVIVESEVNWHLTETRDGWSVLGVDSGYGTAGSPVKTQLGTLKIHPNETRTIRNHRIEFVPEDPDAQSRGITIPYVIKQDPFVFDVNGESEPSYAFGNRDAASEARKLTVNSSANWYVDRIPAWITLSDDTMSGDGAQGGTTSELIFAPKGQNMELAKKSGTIVLKNDVNKLQIPIYVTQDEFLFTTNWASTDKLEAVPENESEEYHSFNLKTSGPWYIDSCPKWLDFPVSEGSYNDDSGIDIYFKANSTNTDEDDRMGEVRFVSELHKNIGTPLYQVVTVIQNGFKFYLGNSEGPDDDVLNEFSELGTDVQKIKVTSPTQWKATASDTWISVDPADGVSGAEVNVSVTMNASRSARTGKVSFTNNDVNDGRGKTIDVMVSQAPYVFDVDFGTDDLELKPILDSNEKIYDINVNSSGAWSVTKDASWVTLSSSGSYKGGNFTISIDNNLSSTKRTAQIVVKNEDLTKDNKVTLRIEQKGFVFDASCYYDIKFDALPSGKSYKINYESSADLKITKPSWIKCDDNGDGVIIVTAEDNINNAPRSGSIELSNSYTSDTKSFNVSQKEYEFSHSGSDSYSLESKSKSDIYIDITSTGSWSASSDASWLRVSPKSGKGNGTITVFAEENTEKQSRSSTVSIICKDNSDMKYQIVFNQKASSEK